MIVEPLIALRQETQSFHAWLPQLPTIATASTSRDGCLEDLEAFLVEWLPTVDAATFRKALFAGEYEHTRQTVELTRSDLVRGHNPAIAFEPNCLLESGFRGGIWVHVLEFGHTFWLEKNEELADRLQPELQQLLDAMQPDPFIWFDFFDASVELIRLKVDLEKSRELASDARDTAAALELLNEIGQPFGSHAYPLLGRDRQVEELKRLFASDTRYAVMLTGREFVGKSAVLEAALDGRQHVFLTSGAQLVAGQSGLGEWQQRVMDVMLAAERLDAVLVFDDLSDLVANESSTSIAQIMRPFLQRGRVRLAGELLESQVDQLRERHVGFFSIFTTFAMEPLDVATTTAILQDRARAEDRVQVDESVVDPILELSQRYLPYQVLPGKAIRLYEDLLTSFIWSHPDKGTFEESWVWEGFAASSGIPPFLLRADEPLLRDRVIGYFQRSIIGQSLAIEKVADTICTVKARLQPPRRPLATFLFVGPTGVGKTEVARTLAHFLFRSPERMIRFDMSEYMDGWAAARLIQGHEVEEGHLTGAIRRQPFSVVLLDEIEKAHPMVFDLLLQVLGAGRLTDARGRTATFENAIVIMTSNLGATHRTSTTGFATEAAIASSHEQYHHEITQHFRPEFINRLDSIVIFDRLSAEQSSDVARVALERLKRREGFDGRRVDLTIEDDALRLIADKGYSASYGARQLRRVIDSEVVAPLGRLLSMQPPPHGASVVIRAAQDDKEARQNLKVAQNVGDLHFDITYHPRSSRQLRTRTQRLSRLRRDFDMYQTLGAFRHFQESVSSLQRQIVEDSTAYWAHNRLTDLMKVSDRISSLNDTIHTMEAMALAALESQESLGELFDELEGIEDQIRSTFVQACTAGIATDDRVVLLLVESQPGLIRRWLAPLLEVADERQWRVGISLADPDNERFREPGPRHQSRELVDQAQDRVLVDVQGPGAEGLLAPESGQHIFYSRAGAPSELIIEAISTWSIEEESEFAYYFTKPPLNPGTVREYMSDGKEVRIGARYTPRLDKDLWEEWLKVSHPRRPAIRLNEPADYFRHIETIAFWMFVLVELSGAEVSGLYYYDEY